MRGPLLTQSLCSANSCKARSTGCGPPPAWADPVVPQEGAGQDLAGRGLLSSPMSPGSRPGAITGCTCLRQGVRSWGWDRLFVS